MSKWALLAIAMIAASYFAYVTAVGGWTDKSVWQGDGFLFLMAAAAVEVIDALNRRRLAK